MCDYFFLPSLLLRTRNLSPFHDMILRMAIAYDDRIYFFLLAETDKDKEENTPITASYQPAADRRRL